MCKSLRQSQQGISIVLAIFILVVLSLLAAALINVLAGGTESVAREVISTRALFAAESGAQRQLNEIFTPGSAMNVAACADAVNTPRTNTFTLGGLFGCGNAVVECEYVTIDSINYFTVTSTGSCGPTGEPSVRVIQVQAKDI